MKITYDPHKRQKTLDERGIDFEHALYVLEGKTFTQEDKREDYGEARFITVGFLQNRMTIVVWTPREGETYHIISMRKANEREQKKFESRFKKDG